MNSARQIVQLVHNIISSDSFFQDLLAKGIIEQKTAPTRYSFGTKSFDAAIQFSDKTLRDWVDINRLPNTKGYESALVWLDHDRDFKSCQLKLAGKNLSNYTTHPFLRKGAPSHHRSQHCHVVLWGKLQLMSDQEITELITVWASSVKDFFYATTLVSSLDD